MELIDLNSADHQVAFYTQLSIAGLLIIVSVVTPVQSLRRLHRHRISDIYNKRSFWSLFKVRNPFRKKYRASIIRMYNMLKKSYSYATDEKVSWDEIQYLSDEDKELVKVLVEETLIIKKKDDGTIYIMEYCSYLLVFVHLLLLMTILLAGLFTSQEIGELNLKKGLTDAAIGKVLSEWMSNYVLLIIGFIQIVSKGTWVNAFAGICTGASSTMTMGQMNSVVACYIVGAQDPIEGLRRELCYAPIRMDGSSWTAPPANTAVIAAAAPLRLFSVEKNVNDQWIVNWNRSANHLVIRSVGSVGSGPSF